MNYLPKGTRKVIFIISEVLAFGGSIIAIVGSQSNMADKVLMFMLAFVFLSIAYNLGIYGACILIQATKNAMKRDMMKSKILEDEYYRMEARKRLDREEL